MRNLLLGLTLCALIFTGGPAHAALTYYDTWTNGWGELPDEDGNGFMGFHARANDSTNWEIAIWEYGHSSTANTDFTWTDGGAYQFSFAWDKAAGTAAYNQTGGAGPVHLVDNDVGAGRTFNTLYIYAKNVQDNAISISNLKVNDIALSDLQGFDGLISIGANGIYQEVVKFIDVGDALVLDDSVTITGEFYLQNPTAVTKESMQVSVKLINNPNLSPVPVPAAVWLLGSGLLGMAGLRSRSIRRGNRL